MLQVHLFIFGAIAVWIFSTTHNSGILIAVCHYGSNILVGICMRFYGKNQMNEQKIESEMRI